MPGVVRGAKVFAPEGETDKGDQAENHHCKREVSFCFVCHNDVCFMIGRCLPRKITPVGEKAAFFARKRVSVALLGFDFDC